MVPKAEVAATDTATGITRLIPRGPMDLHQIPNLLDGTYTISVTATGFQKSVYSGVVVDAGHITDMPLN